MQSSVSNRLFYDGKTTKQAIKRPLDISELLTDEDVELKTRELKRLKPTDGETTAKIIALMDQLRESRQAWIERDRPSLTEILKKYERFGDTPSLVRNAHILAFSDTA